MATSDPSMDDLGAGVVSGDDSTPQSISLDKSNPTIADMFSDCKPGDEITLNLSYGDKSAALKATVGEDSDTAFTATINGTTDAEDAADGGDDEADEGESPVPAAPAKKDAAMEYLKSKRA